MKQSITIRLNAWIICAVLLVANLGTIGLWRPWESRLISDRTIEITGSTTIESAPDQFVFNPYYQKEGTDKKAIDAELSKLSKTIITKLKALGVNDSAIKTDVNSYDYGIYYSIPENKATTTLYLTVTIRDKSLAQKVQDYLTTTSPLGSITPQISFSSAKQKELENQARDGVLKDAKSKATATAKQLDVKLGKVIKVSDITSYGITPFPWMMDSASGTADSIKGSDIVPSYNIQPGLNEYSFSVEVTYELN